MNFGSSEIDGDMTSINNFSNGEHSSSSSNGNTNSSSNNNTRLPVIQDFKLIKILGLGSFGKVCLVSLMKKQPGAVLEVYAMKIQKLAGEQSALSIASLCLYWFAPFGIDFYFVLR
jgi:hypothetical protein